MTQDSAARVISRDPEPQEQRAGRMLVLAVTLQILQQLMGVQAFVLLGPQAALLLGIPSRTWKALTAATALLGTLSAASLIDHWGRRMLLVVGAVEMACACLMAALALHWHPVACDLTLRHIAAEQDLNFLGVVRLLSSAVMAGKGAQLLMAASVLMYLLSYACSWGSCISVYCTEIFPQQDRARSVGITGIAGAILGFFVAHLTPQVLERWCVDSFFFLRCHMHIGLAPGLLHA